MPKVTPDELKQLLARDLPHALVPLAESDSATNGHAEAAPRKKGEHGPVNLLATKDAVVAPDALPDVARYLRDRLEYELLSNLTAVDYLAHDVIEVVYHFVRLAGGMLVVKTRVPRDAPVLPSLTPIWPGADFQEREAYDLFGVVFTGHSNLKRIYMWDEFEGFPMRRDFPKQGDKYLGEAE